MTFFIVNVLTGKIHFECIALETADMLIAELKRPELFIAANDGTMDFYRPHDTPIERFLETAKWIEIMR